MHKQIKEMAEAALKLQNKNFMDETLRKIVAVCDEAGCERVSYGVSDQVYVNAEMKAIAQIAEPATELTFPVISMPEEGQDGDAAASGLVTTSSNTPEDFERINRKLDEQLNQKLDEQRALNGINLPDKKSAGKKGGAK